MKLLRCPASRNLQFAIFSLSMLFIFFFLPNAALAHKIDVLVKVEGRAIIGSVEYHGGGPVKNGSVKAFDLQGQEIGSTTTDEQGKFRLNARWHCDHRLQIDAGDGHGAEKIVSAKDLPAELPERNVSDAAISHEEHSHKMTDSELLADIHGDVDQIQEQLQRNEQQMRFRDILGGIGFIVGLAGLAYGCYYRGKLEKMRDKQ
jgi:nickel transport protein